MKNEKIEALVNELQKEVKKVIIESIKKDAMKYSWLDPDQNLVDYFEEYYWETNFFPDTDRGLLASNSPNEIQKMVISGKIK